MNKLVILFFMITFSLFSQEIVLGTTKEEALKLFGNDCYRFEGDTVVRCDDVVMFGKQAHVIYNFYQNKIFLITYVFDGNIINELYEAAVLEYGKSSYGDSADIVWFKDDWFVNLFYDEKTYLCIVDNAVLRVKEML
jgi:hypothetical protein